MTPTGSFHQFLTDLRQGDPTATTTLVRRYTRRLIGLARQHLRGRLRQRVDPEDVLQSVFRSFFCRTGAGEFDLAGEHDLWRLLVRLTLNKCGGRARFEQATCRDVRREQGSAETDGQPFASSTGPAPVEAAMLADVTACVMRRLSTGAKRRIFEMSLQGHSVAEISAALGYYERGVERVRAEIRRLLHELLTAETLVGSPPPRQEA